VVTTVLVTVLTGAAVVIDNLGVVVEVGGAILATSLIYIFPALALLGTLGPDVRSGAASRVQRLEYAANQGLLLVGVLLVVVGVAVALRGS